MASEGEDRERESESERERERERERENTPFRSEALLTDVAMLGLKDHCQAVTLGSS